MREIDISLRGRIGSSDVLAIIECRKHKGIQDVRWIEQIYGKSQSVLADKAMAISSSGFTEQARKKAKYLNIEFRTLDEIDPTEINQWFSCMYGTHCITNAKIIEVIIKGVDGKSFNISGFDINTPIFQRKKDGRLTSFKEIWEILPKPCLYEKVPDDGTHVVQNIKIDYVMEGESKPEDALEELENLKLEVNSMCIEISEIVISAELWLETVKVPLIAKSYRSFDKTLVDIAEFKFEDHGKTYTLNVLNYAKSEKEVCKIAVIPIDDNDEIPKIDIELDTEIIKPDGKRDMNKKIIRI